MPHSQLGEESQFIPIPLRLEPGIFLKPFASITTESMASDSLAADA